MKTFTGNKQADMLILQKLDDKDLINACQTDKYISQLCSKDMFWLNRIIGRHGKESLLAKRSDESYRNFYIKKRYYVILLCQTLKKYADTNLVIDDFYDPRTGFINQTILRAGVVLKYLLMKIGLHYMTKTNSKYIEETKESLKQILSNIPEYTLDSISSNTFNLTDLDISTFLKIINVNLGKMQLVRRFGQSELAKALHKIIPLHEAVKFIIYIHNGFRNDIIPLDITWKELCKNRYVLDYEP